MSDRAWREENPIRHLDNLIKEKQQRAVNRPGDTILVSPSFYESLKSKLIKNESFKGEQEITYRQYRIIAFTDG